jgi:hypothetical protein
VQFLDWMIHDKNCKRSIQDSMLRFDCAH